MQPPWCAERHLVLASVGVPVLAAIVAYWWSAAAVVVVAAAVCISVMLQRWWRFEVAALRKETALLNAAEHELFKRVSPRPPIYTALGTSPSDRPCRPKWLVRPTVRRNQAGNHHRRRPQNSVQVSKSQ